MLRRLRLGQVRLEVHARLREKRKDEEGDPLERVAEDVADEVRLLCFDEMVVNNPADAMILSRLFEHLLQRGVRVVTTSNRPPRDLYRVRPGKPFNSQRYPVVGGYVGGYVDAGYSDPAYGTP